MPHVLVMITRGQLCDCYWKAHSPTIQDPPRLFNVFIRTFGGMTLVTHMLR